MTEAAGRDRASVRSGWSGEFPAARAPSSGERDPGFTDFSALVDGVAVGLAVVDPDGRLVHVNPAYCAMHGATGEQLLGRPVLELILEEDRSGKQAPDPALLSGEAPHFVMEERHVRLDDGSVRWVQVTVAPLWGDDGALAYLVATCQDIDGRKQAQEQLAAASWLRRIAGRIARLGAWSIDLPGFRVQWSPEISEMLQADPALVPDAARALSYYRGADRGRLAAAIERCAEDGTPFDLEAEVETEQHDRLHVRVVGEPRHDANGQLVGVVGTFQDITPLARARAAGRQASEQLASTLQNISDGVVTYDTDWRISYLNPAFERMTGLDRSQLLGEVLWDALPGLVGTEVERTYRRAAATGEAVVIDRFTSGRDGRTYRLSVLPAEEGGLTVYLRDISTELEEEQRLRTLADAEHRAAEELRSVDRMKNAFITAVSHELRTPLTVVRGMADTLIRLRDSADPAVRSRIEDALAEHARRLGALLDELLDTDRLVRGSLVAERQPVDLPALVQRVIDESAVAHRANVRMPTSLVASVDAVLVERSVRNLLENAAKYAPDGSVVVQVDGDGGGGFVLAVSDEGPGIPDAHAERIFEPFHRVLDHHQPGTGIGLSLVAEFARLHGGRAWADTDRDLGARIVVEVPAALSP
jgi:PAS domain S-box-containing protein